MHDRILNVEDKNSLVEQCRQQNHRAQKQLFDKYYSKMMTVCMRYLKSEEDALEVIDNAFLKIFSKINQYKSEGSLEGWMKKIVINSAIDFVRRNKAYRSNFIYPGEFNHYNEPKNEGGQEEWIDETLIFSKEEIAKMIGDLPDATQVVFNMFAIDEFTHKQISEKLKISEGTSKWHLSNARKILKEKINRALEAKKKNPRHEIEPNKY